MTATPLTGHGGAGRAAVAPGRLAAMLPVAGIPAGVLGVLAALVATKPPATDASAADISTYVNDHRSALHLAAVLLVVATPLFAVFAAGVAGRASRPAGVLLGAGAAATVATAAAQLVATTALVQVAVPGGAAPVITAMNGLAWLGYASLGVGTAVMLAGGALCAVEGAVPRWTAAPTAVAAVAAVVASAAAAVDGTTGVGVLGLLAYLVLAAWMVVAGAWSLRARA